MSDSSKTLRDELLSRLSVVLVRPAFAGNIGATARVMTNFGVRRGLLVSPRCDLNSVEARQFATGPSAVTLATMQSVKSLKDVISGEVAVVAMTRRTGHLRKPTLTLQNIAERLQSGPVAVVFGPEESGLSDDDVKQCTDIVTLDVAETMPSLNLSHAVAVVLSRIFECCSTSKSSTSSQPSISATDLLALFDRLKQTVVKLEASGKITNAERFTRILSQSLSRSHLDAAELAAWHGVFSAID